jgi:hypothetical protein
MRAPEAPIGCPSAQESLERALKAAHGGAGEANDDDWIGIHPMSFISGN